MEYKATAKSVRVSPRKARMVAAVVKKFSPNQALEKLQFIGRGAARPIAKTLQSAIANSKKDAKELKIKNILINEGIRMRRYDKSHRFGRDRGIIHKPTSHIQVILEG